MRDSFIFHKAWHNSIKELPADDYKMLAEAIINYSLYGEEPHLEGLMKSAFEMMRDRSDNDKAKWEAQVSNAKKGVEKRKAKSSQSEPSLAKFSQSEPNVYVNDNDNVNVNDNELINYVIPNTFYPITRKKTKEEVLNELDNMIEKERVSNG